MQTEVEIKIEKESIEYSVALSQMEKRHGDVLNNTAPELIWILEHEDVYTAGVSAKENDLIDSGIVPVFKTGRGGKFTYHGPGQIVCYFVINLKKRAGTTPDVKCFVECLEDVIIKTLQEFGIHGEKRKDRIGVWVQTSHGEEKIAAIGVKFSKGVTTHGLAINVNPNMQKFAGIVPCGIAEFGVCSMTNLGVFASVSDVRDKLINALKSSEKENFYQKRCKNF